MEGIPLEMPCPSCGEVICLTQSNDSHIAMETYLYQGKCGNDLNTCPMGNKTVYCCSACHSESSFTRSKGFISKWKYIGRHTKSKYHIERTSRKKICPQVQDEPQLSIDDGVEHVDFDDNVSIPAHTDDLSISNELETNSQFIGNALHNGPMEIDLKQLGFDENSKTPIFLKHEMTKPGFGARYLVGKAYGVDPNAISSEEAYFCLSLSSLLVQLTDKQKETLSELMTIAGNNGDEGLSIFKNIRLPTSKDDFDVFFLRGKNAILPNLPHPIPKPTSDKSHSYVSLKDLLANELGKATKYEDYLFQSQVTSEACDSVQSVSMTKAAKTLLVDMRRNEEPSEFTMYLWIREWRDDFDPNNTKSSRNQVWCNTYTICPPRNENTHGLTTYFMGLSSKGEDHGNVESILASELESLSTTGMKFYHGGMKQVVTVKIDKLLISVDRPERTSIFQIGDHNGSYSTCWGYATQVDGTRTTNNLPSCDSCRKWRIKQLLEGRTTMNSETERPACDKCSDWCLEDPKFLFLAPPEYPIRYDETDGAPLPPKFRDLWHHMERLPTTPDGQEARLEEPMGGVDQ